MKKLTKRTVDAASPSADRDYCLWDPEVRGFRLRVRRSGRKTFEFYYRAGRRQRLLVIGDLGPFTPDQARKIAEQARHSVNLGRDPQEEKASSRRAITMSELVEAYLSDGRVDKPLKRESSWVTDASYLRRHLVPLLGHRRVRDLKASDLAKWQADVAAGKTARSEKLGLRSRSIVRGGRGAAARGMRSCAAMLAWAEKRELIEDNPARRVSKLQDGQRERFLTDDEAESLFLKLDEMEAAGGLRADHADLFRLLALTGARLSEIRALGWSEVDFDRARITLSPDRHKTGRSGPKILNLSMPALAILKRRENATPWVFPKSEGYAGPIEPPRRAWNAVATAAGQPGLRLHDLRHTFASLLIKDGHSLSFVQKALGHARPEVTARYAHLKDEATRVAFDHVGKIYQGAKFGH